MGGHSSSTVCVTKFTGRHAVREYNNASSFQYLGVGFDYPRSDLYVCSVLYVCVHMVSLRIKGNANFKLKNQHIN